MASEPDFPSKPSDRPEPERVPGAQNDAAFASRRFGRLALCFAATGALAFGVIGTVAYGVWFNHDQRAYAEAMSNARLALAATPPVASSGQTTLAFTRPAPAASANYAMVPTSTGKPVAAGVDASTSTDNERGQPHASWTGEVTRSAASHAQTTDAAPASNVDHDADRANQPLRRANRSADSTTQQAQGGRNRQDARLGAQNSRAQTATQRRKGSLFARVGSFFRRANYRQHGNESQQDIYSHS
ncbi:hypothetical protein P3T18_003304 [Paraburkholderia sp. GAS199]|uniref:hypothetical protein n=1 Tax=Paraburkholderia sp. GAS199 TaxID=3035126 RepID=UPI003D1BEC05